MARIVGGASAALAGASTSMVLARNSIPEAAPTLKSLGLWIASGSDLLALISALGAGGATAYAIWQVFSPAPASSEDVATIAAEARTRAESTLEGLIGEFRKDSNSVSTLVARSLTGDLLSRLTEAASQGRFNEEEKLQLVRAVLCGRGSDGENEQTADEDFADALADSVALISGSSLPGAAKAADQALKGKVIAAAEFMLKHLAPVSDDPFFIYKLCGELVSRFQVQLALTCFNLAHAAYPDDPDVNRKRLVLYVDQHDLANAAKVAEEILAKEKSAIHIIPALDLLGHVHVMRREWEQASAQYLRAETLAIAFAESETGSSDLLARVQNGIGWMNGLKGNLTESRHYYMKAMATRRAAGIDRGSPKDTVETVTVLSNLASAENHLGNYDLSLKYTKLAISELSSVMDAADDQPRVREAYAELQWRLSLRLPRHEKLKRRTACNKGIKSILKLLRQDPQKVSYNILAAHLHLERGWCFSSLDQAKEACLDFTEAVKFQGKVIDLGVEDPVEYEKFAGFSLDYASVLEGQGSITEALGCLIKSRDRIRSAAGRVDVNTDSGFLGELTSEISRLSGRLLRAASDHSGAVKSTI